MERPPLREQQHIVGNFLGGELLKNVCQFRFRRLQFGDVQPVERDEIIGQVGLVGLDGVNIVEGVIFKGPADHAGYFQGQLLGRG